MGGLFIAVVMYFPNGLAGLWDTHGRQALAKVLRRSPRPPIKPPSVTPVVNKAPSVTPQPAQSANSTSLESQP